MSQRKQVKRKNRENDQLKILTQFKQEQCQEAKKGHCCPLSSHECYSIFRSLYCDLTTNFWTSANRRPIRRITRRLIVTPGVNLTGEDSSKTHLLLHLSLIASGSCLAERQRDKGSIIRDEVEGSRVSNAT